MIGFIGAGNMGNALIRSLLHSRLYKKKLVYVYDPNINARKRIPKENNVHICRNISEIFAQCRYLFLCIKPKDVDLFFSHNQTYLKKHHILISIIAGLRITSIQKIAHNSKLKVCRIMPNLASSIGKGVGTVSYSSSIQPSEKKILQQILSCSGVYLTTPESLVDSVTAISGCGPAFVFLFINALTDAGIKLGIPKKQVSHFVTEMLLGATHLVRSSKLSPLELTNQVTSPGGMTIEGVNWLKKNQFHKIVGGAVEKAFGKAQRLNQSK